MKNGKLIFISLVLAAVVSIGIWYFIYNKQTSDLYNLAEQQIHSNRPQTAMLLYKMIVDKRPLALFAEPSKGGFSVSRGIIQDDDFFSATLKKSIDFRWHFNCSALFLLSLSLIVIIAMTAVPKRIIAYSRKTILFLWGSTLGLIVLGVGGAGFYYLSEKTFASTEILTYASGIVFCMVIASLFFQQSTAEYSAQAQVERAVDIPHTEDAYQPSQAIMARGYGVLCAEKGKVIGFKEMQISRKGIKIGRDGDQVDVIVDDPKCSSFHCWVLELDGKFYVIDKNSRNGTYVKGKKVSKMPLKDGDIIQLGKNGFASFIFEKR